ncbi:SPOR domain-containing protein [Thauera sp. AutoDN2]|uniref:SPOR domain-containing protein n=1 Tax=Thauera sp. AutoDN2 TaxID=3416051 RepID=UPI002A4D8DF1|nr:SPOR domain-containing protein [Thauera sp.]
MSRDRKPVRKPARPPARSAGGTLIGIFIGLVLGAMIAAGAAWYFTRSNPFQPAPTAPRVEAPSQGGPAALPGKPGDRPVAKQDFDFYRILPQGDNVPAPGQAAVQPVPVVEAVPQPVQPSPVRLYLQVGAFENPSEADNLKARLALSGIEASAQRAQLSDGRVVHRVRVGPFATPEDMNPMRARLAEAGFNASVSRNP